MTPTHGHKHIASLISDAQYIILTPCARIFKFGKLEVYLIETSKLRDIDSFLGLISKQFVNHRCFHEKYAWFKSQSSYLTPRQTMVSGLYAYGIVGEATRDISAQVTTSSPSLYARAWCGDECWDQPILPYPMMRYVFSHTNIYLKRKNRTEQWNVCNLALSHRPFVVSHFRCFALSLFCTFVVSYYHCFALSLFRTFAVLYFCCFVLSLFRTFVVSHFRCFVLSLFRTIVVSHNESTKQRATRLQNNETAKQREGNSQQRKDAAKQRKDDVKQRNNETEKQRKFERSRWPYSDTIAGAHPTKNHKIKIILSFTYLH